MRTSKQTDNPSRLPRVIIVLVAMVFLAGCMTDQRTTYTPRDAAFAEVGGFTNIRVYLDDNPQLLAKSDVWAVRRNKGRINYLVISGGGAGGAFAVGVLSAWSKTGTRPNFDVVTGVSTGALIAPYAFLGKTYDDRLVKLYTSGVARDLAETRWLGAGIFGTSLLKEQPLRQMVERYMTADVMRAIAEEHAKGRRLLVMTVNLDTQRAVVWNMGAIAASGQPDALQLFRNVLIASASVPGIYPAVMIKAQAGNHRFEEMHSDGGSISQILTMPEVVMARPGNLKSSKFTNTNLYVIVNNALMPEFSKTTDSTIPVLARAYSVLIKSQTRSALMALYGYAQRTGMHFHVASIDRQLAYSISDPFNTDYMRSVFTLGYAGMMSGQIWKDQPVFP